MRRDIEIGGQTVACISNAATPVIYRQVFHEDLLVFLQEFNNARRKDTILPGTTDMFCRLAYVMQGQAQMSTTEAFRKLSLDGFLTWLEGFRPLDFEMAGGDILNLYYENEETQSKSKNA